MARNSKKFRFKKLQINLTNRWLYTLIAFFGLIVIGVFVYAVVPNPGHAITEIEAPSGCSTDQFLQWDGSDWTCADAGGIDGSGTANYIPKFTAATTVGDSIIYETGGNIGIGTISPSAPLNVKGADTTVTQGSCIGTALQCNYYNFPDEGLCEAQEACSWEPRSCNMIGQDNCGQGQYEDCYWDDFCIGTYYTCAGPATDCSEFGQADCSGQSECNWDSATRWTSNTAIFEKGKVGIGDTNPYYVLELPNIADTRGQARANYWTTYSSIRWKENIVPIDNALDKVNQLQGVYFNWKPEYGGTPSIGLIAEDVGKVIPEVVAWEDDGTYALSLDYDHLIALLIEAIKEQQKEIEQLKEAI